MNKKYCTKCKIEYPSNLTFCVCGTKLVDIQEVEARRVIHSGGVYNRTTVENVAVLEFLQNLRR